MFFFPELVQQPTIFVDYCILISTKYATCICCTARISLVLYLTELCVFELSVFMLI